ncbi:type II secretion system F family protein [Pengzhenrongella sicca]|uniref:Type II secretion system F family protein n=1 Tax=Pengzhenrongella sicca TaxID=2819238 RepID=A0A8A4ZDK9_9MICO|nr:type II secretion system F family protein [Pengzhenrongella sicca]QTE30042.1 type II secretion system F family protein [Pengzhenrongella sicca]
MRTVLAALFGGMIGVGVWLGVMGMTRVSAAPSPRPLIRRRRRDAVGRGRSQRPRSTRWAIALGAGLLGWAVTGWPVVALIAAAMVRGLPVLLGTAKAAGRVIDRVEGIEEWTRRLGDLLVTGIGLEQAITDSVRSCPAIIAGEVGALANRIHARWPAETALRAFAADLDDGAGDLVACALILAARRRGPGLARVLSSVADSVSEDVAVRRKIEAERAKPRATARAVTIITLAVVAGGALTGDYLTPYGTPLGQLILIVLTCGFVGCLAWMRSMTVTRPEPRFLASPVGVEVGAGRLGKVSSS